MALNYTKLFLLTVVSAASLLSLILFFWSMGEAGDIDVDSGNSNSFLPGKSVTSGACEVLPWSDFRPVRLVAKLPDSSGNIRDVYFQCAWPPNDLLFRSLVTILTPLLGFFTVYYLTASKFDPPRRHLMFVIMVINGGTSLIMFITMCIDAHLVDKSVQWCDWGMQGVDWTLVKFTASCAYGDLISVPLMDASLVVLWGLAAFLMFKYMKFLKENPSHSNSYAQGEDAGPENDSTYSNSNSNAEASEKSPLV